MAIIYFNLLSENSLILLYTCLANKAFTTFFITFSLNKLSNCKNNYSVANPPLPSERVPALRKTRILYLTSRGIY